MKVLHIVGGLDRGGIETWLTRSLPLFQQHGVSSGVVVYGTHTYPLEPQVTPFAEIHKVPLRPFGSHVKRIWNLIHEHDLVHAHTHFNEAIPLALARLAGIPAVAHCHLEHPWRAETGWIRKTYAFAASGLIHHTSSSRIAVSRQAAESLSWRPGDHHLLPCGIDMDPFRTYVQSGLRARLGLEGRFVVGHVGRFEPQKNHAYLLQVFRKVLDSRPEACLVLLGTGSLESEVEATCRDLGIREHVYSLGSVSNVLDHLMEVFDVFCLPSHFEGLPVALLEAQAAGLSCVVSDAVDPSAAFSERITFLPLEAGADAWAEHLCSAPPRRDTAQLDVRFDNRTTVQTLVGLYQDLLIRRGERPLA